jgi:CRISPR-associated endoribonuclease Cas6
MKNESLHSCYLELFSKKNVTIVSTRGDQTHALFLNLIKQFDPALSARLHSELGYRPYTVSPLYGGIIVGGHILIRRGLPCHLRITLLDGGILWGAIQTYFLEAGPIQVRLGDIDFHLTRLIATPSNDFTSWAGATDWQSLITLPAQSIITFHFSTATAFSLGGREFYLFPEPLLVWQSLLRTWNRYAPEQMHMEKQTICESFSKQIAVMGCVLRHAFLHFSGYVQKGFEGWCTYQLSENQQQSSNLTSLAAFAKYAGVGYKTTMGMGQVRVVFGEMASS